METLRILTVWLIAFVALVSSAVAQEKTRVAPTPGAAKEAVDVAVAIVAWTDQDRKTAEKMGQVLKPAVDAIGSGAKLTKADAARIALPLDNLQKLQDWLTNVISKSKKERKLLIFVKQQDGSGFSSHRRNVKCPICGSTQHEFCYRPLDYDKVELEEIPIDDPELSCITLSNGQCVPVDCCGTPGSATGGPKPGGKLVNIKRTVIIFLFGGTAQNYKQERQVLVKAVKEVVEEAISSTSRLVIKTKSVPP